MPRSLSSSPQSRSLSSFCCRPSTEQARKSWSTRVVFPLLLNGNKRNVERLLRTCQHVKQQVHTVVDMCNDCNISDTRPTPSDVEWTFCFGQMIWSDGRFACHPVRSSWHFHLHSARNRKGMKTSLTIRRILVPIFTEKRIVPCKRWDTRIWP